MSTGWLAASVANRRVVGRAWALGRGDAAVGAHNPAAAVRARAGVEAGSARGVATATVMALWVSLLRCSTVYGDPAARVNRSIADSCRRRTKIVPTFLACIVDRRPGPSRYRHEAAWMVTGGPAARTHQHRERYRPSQVLAGATVAASQCIRGLA